MSLRLTGLIAAVFSPFDREGALDTGVIPDYARALRRDGVAGVFVNGTTGEGLSLSATERRRAAEAWAAQRDDDLPLVVHVGHLALSEACDLARHAAELGADAIAACAPCFCKPDAAGMAAWLGAIADAAPDIPLYYYHIPALAGTTFPAHEVLRRAPRVHGLKFTHEHLMDFQRCRELDDGRVDCLFGRDEMLLAGLAHGARGAVGSTYNWAAPLYRDIVAAFATGDLERARADQARAQAMVAVMQRHGGIAAAKAIMALHGLECGPCRLPLPAVDRDALRAELDAVTAIP